MKNIYKKRLMGATALSALALGVLTFNAEVTQAEEGSVERIQGNDRYETATLISNQSFESSDTVIIANAMGFADALSGVPLAYEKEAPILLAHGTKLKTATITEIKRLGAKEAIILGGDSAISQSIENELKNLGLSVQRLSGDNRYETSAIIADELAKTSPSNKAVIVDGMEFADAMSIAPFAAQEGMPIYLTKTNSLSNAEDLKDYNETYIVGGENAVSKIVEDALNSVIRLAGMDRYETNREVIDHFGVESNELYVSTGLNFADALTGSVLAARNNSAVALVRGDVHSKLLAQFEGNPFNAFTILGGEAAVSNKVQDTLTTYIASKTEVVKEEKQENFVDFKVKEVEKDTLPTGKINIIQEGKKGYDEVTYAVTLVNGVEKNRVETGRITEQPIEEIKEIGTLETEVTEEVIIENKVNFETVNQENNQLPEEETHVDQEGVDGYDEVTFEVTYADGTEIDRTEIERHTIAPVNEVVVIGTQIIDILTEKSRENETNYEIIEQNDDSMPRGEQVLVTEGQIGYDDVTYEVTYTNGVETNRQEISRNKIEPINTEIIVGIKDIITKKYSIQTGYSSQGFYRGIFETTFVNGIEKSERKIADIQGSYSSMRVSTSSQIVTVPYSTKYIDDSSLEEEQQEVITIGEDGLEKVEFTNIYLDNKLVFRGENKREVILKPVDAVIAIGTKTTENNF